MVNEQLLLSSLFLFLSQSYYYFSDQVLILNIQKMKSSKSMTANLNNLQTNVFQNLFKMSYEPLYVDNGKLDEQKKNYFSTIFCALSIASQDTIVKVNTGLYNEKLQLKLPNTRLQASEPNINVVIANDQFPSLVVDLPNPNDKVYLESLKFAHLCELNKYIIKWPSLKGLKQSKYRKLKLGDNINTNIIVRKGILQIDECKFSLAAQKDASRLNACIIVEQEGTLIMNRSQIIGGAGTIGIYCNGGKIAIRECTIKEHGGIGILANGKKSTNVILKNSTISKCTEGVVLNGPFCSSIQNNIITESNSIGILTLSGNSSNIINNEIKDCKTGIQVQNACPTIMKNICFQSKEVAFSLQSKMNNQCWPLLKFNVISQSKKGGIIIAGGKNKSVISSNTIQYNNKFGIRVENSANPHIFLNKIGNNLGNGIHISANSTAFIEKNNIYGSLNSNIVLEGPGNIDNYVYNNEIQGARGQGIFVINSQKFLIAKNHIHQNFNGILSVTSVISIEENLIQANKSNGIMLVDDNELEICQNSIQKNRMAGIVCRNTSRAKINLNTFQSNNYELVIENDHQFMKNIESENSFPVENYDIRVPKNYQCSLI